MGLGPYTLIGRGLLEGGGVGGRYGRELDVINSEEIVHS